MIHTRAHLVMCHRIVQGVPTFTGLRICSESSVRLTQGVGLIYSELISCDGATFDEATRNTFRAAVLIWPWARAYLLEAGYEEPEAQGVS